MKASDDPFGHLYLMYKVHKDPVIIDEKLCWKPRPVVSDCASVTNALSKWVDTMLQPMMQGLQTYFKDSFAFKAKLDNFVIPPRGQLFTCDAEEMYPDIETRHHNGNHHHLSKRRSYPGAIPSLQC